MLESVEIRPTESASLFDKKGGIFGPKGFELYLFISLSFGYMVLWVSISSLISLFNDQYGENYFVLLNIAFYSVGYPVSYIQRKLDAYYDTIYNKNFKFVNKFYQLHGSHRTMQ